VDPWPFLNIVSVIQNGDKIFHADFHCTSACPLRKMRWTRFASLRRNNNLTNLGNLKQVYTDSKGRWDER